jgi:hypothetical protein
MDLVYLGLILVLYVSTVLLARGLDRMGRSS